MIVLQKTWKVLENCNYDSSRFFDSFVKTTRCNHEVLIKILILMSRILVSAPVMGSVACPYDVTASTMIVRTTTDLAVTWVGDFTATTTCVPACSVQSWTTTNAQGGLDPGWIDYRLRLLDSATEYTVTVSSIIAETSGSDPNSYVFTACTR